MVSAFLLLLFLALSSADLAALDWTNRLTDYSDDEVIVGPQMVKERY